MSDSSLTHALDAQLLARLGRSDERALELLLERHWTDLVQYASRLVDADGAEDVVQDAFVRLWDRRRDWRPGSAARPILFRIVRNLAVDRQRASAIRAQWIASVSAGQALAPDAAADSEEAELRIAINRALQALSPREREVLTLSRFGGFSREEVAGRTGLAKQTVSNVLTTAMAKLWRALASYLDDEQPIPLRRSSRRR